MGAFEHIIWFWYSSTIDVVDEPPTFNADQVALAFGADSASVLGRGSFGETWKLVEGPQQTAVKLIIDPDYPLERVEREIEGLRRGKCEWVVDLLDVGAVDVDGNEHAFMRFEFVEGGDVAGHVRDGNWPTEDELRLFVDGTLRGLAALHQNDAVHRDIKLENIALRDGRWDRPVVLDLGLARIIDGGTLTAYPTLLGTRPYMAPEQLRGERARKATDLWALAIVVHILATRNHPFYGDHANRVELGQALRVITEKAAPHLDLPAPLPELVERWLDPIQHRRGSARRAISDMNERDNDD